MRTDCTWMALAEVFLECSGIFPWGFIVEAVKMQRGYNKRSKKNTKPQTEVVISNHKLNIKALSPCHVARPCHSLLSTLVGRVVFHSLPIRALVYKCWIINIPVTSVLGLSSLDTTGFWSLSCFPPEIGICGAEWSMGCLSPRQGSPPALGTPPAAAGAESSCSPGSMVPSSKPGSVRGGEA